MKTKPNFIVSLTTYTTTLPNSRIFPLEFHLSLDLLLTSSSESFERCRLSRYIYTGVRNRLFRPAVRITNQ